MHMYMRKCSISEQSVKIVLVGNEGSGKTCLVNRLTYNTFSEHTFSTIGAMYLQKYIELETGKRIKLDFWDTAGQERFATLLPLYYRGASIVILTCNLNDFDDSFKKVKLLYEEVLAYNSCKFILVGTKYDVMSDIDTKEINKFVEDNDMEYMVTSSKTGYNIQELMTCIVDRVKKSQNEVLGLTITSDDNRVCCNIA